MLGSRFDLDKTVAAIAAKRELERKPKGDTRVYVDFDAKLQAFVDALTQEGATNGIFTPSHRRERTRF